MSFPTRERGLKLNLYHFITRKKRSFPTRERGLKSVNPCALSLRILSFPTRERGLKSVINRLFIYPCHVVPHAGTWIEIQDRQSALLTTQSRSPRGNVD